jgi:hypothetical protein
VAGGEYLKRVRQRYHPRLAAVKSISELVQVLLAVPWKIGMPGGNFRLKNTFGLISPAYFPDECNCVVQSDLLLLHHHSGRLSQTEKTC